MDIPVLFNTAMIQAIMENKKHMTRRIIKPQPPKGAWPIFDWLYCYKVEGWAFQYSKEIALGLIHNPIFKLSHNGKCPYGPIGTTLWVRETWKYYEKAVGKGENFRVERFLAYKADQGNDKIQKSSEWFEGKWHPSIHMPKTACRIRLKITDIRIERLQNITEEDAKAEGVTPIVDAHLNILPNGYRLAFSDLWNSIYSSPMPAKNGGTITHYESYPWDDVQETREYKGLPWKVYGNPWVYPISFEKVKL